VTDPVPLRDFDLLRPIGAGATGHVWYGVHRTTGTEVAVKTLRRFLGDPEIVSLFEREARAIASLDHPHIVALLDFGTVDPVSAARGCGRLVEGAPFLVMEHVSGGTIGAPPIRDAVSLHRMLVVLLSALGHAHARGVLHRDLKLSNVLRAGDGDVRPGLRLVDFGIAWFAGGERDDLVSVGTPAYMAPEQLSADASDLGPWTDLYALACLTWRLVCANPPVDLDGDRMQLLFRKTRMDLSPWTPTFAVPDGLRDLLVATMSPSPEDRPRSSAELARRLSELDWSDRAEPERDRRPPKLLGAGLPLLALRPPEPVGRERALAFLHGALRRVTDSGALEVVAIEAEESLDRDAVVRHFCEASAEEGPALAVRLDGDDPDLPARVLRHMTGTAELRGAELRERLGRWLTGRGEESELALEVLVDVLSGDASEELDRSQERERRVIAGRVLALEATRQPLIVVLSGGAGFGRGIGRQLVRLARLEPLPILLLLVQPSEAADPASVAPLLGHPRLSRLELPPLSRARLTELADSLLPLHGQLRDRLVGRADGRPGTLRAELVALAEAGALVAVRGRFRLRPGASLPPQEDARARAVSRLDAIGGASGRLVAELIAQLDGPAPAALLRHAAAPFDVDAGTALRRLARAGLASQSRQAWTLRSGELAAALRAEPRHEARSLAVALLDGAESSGARIPSEWRARLLEVAAREREALTLRLRILEARERRGDRDRAELELQAARTLVDALGIGRDEDPALRLDLWALTHRSRTRSPGFVADGRALARRAAGLPDVAAEALRLVSVEHRATGHPAEADRAAAEAVAAATEPVGRARALHTLGLARREVGQPEDALAAYAEAVSLAEPRDRLTTRKVLADRADLLQALGRWAESATDIDCAEALISKTESSRNRSVSTITQLQLVLAQGRLAQAREMATRLVADLRYLGIDGRLGSVLMLAGEVFRFSGELEAAGDHYRQALLMFEAVGSPLATLARANLGMVTYAQGDVEDAYHELTTLLRETEADGVGWMVGPIRIARAPAAAAMGRWDLAESTLSDLEASVGGLHGGARVDLDGWWVSRELLLMAARDGNIERIGRLEGLVAAIEAKLPRLD